MLLYYPFRGLLYGLAAGSFVQRPVCCYLQTTDIFPHKVFPIEVRQLLAHRLEGLLAPPDCRLQVGPLRFHGGPVGVNPCPVFRGGFVVSNGHFLAYLDSFPLAGFMVPYH